ncbi:hypothetical protein [Chryseobacterium bernardetii]|uniref:hypothetical protein n=2 Tax=Chryseobacterium bernardetii TaxID=1241978 RepID=UPI000F4F73A4|nr:hypothetical protein [Chryseobacterium bernardetii]
MITIAKVACSAMGFPLSVILSLFCIYLFFPEGRPRLEDIKQNTYIQLFTYYILKKQHSLFTSQMMGSI